MSFYWKLTYSATIVFALGHAVFSDVDTLLGRHKLSSKESVITDLAKWRSHGARTRAANQQAEQLSYMYKGKFTTI